MNPNRSFFHPSSFILHPFQNGVLEVKPLPATNLRSNIATWAVSTTALPAIASAMLSALPPEPYDTSFVGQDIGTIYFDAASLPLRRARRKGDRYLTLRLRCYATPKGDNLYALSAKTESEKWRQEVADEDADFVRDYPDGIMQFLPANLRARLEEIVANAHLTVVAVVCCRRYAVESVRDRLTLDVGVRTWTGKRLHSAILELKSTNALADVPNGLLSLPLFPLKLSKFLWATQA
jgi:hypothetical protein